MNKTRIARLLVGSFAALFAAAVAVPARAQQARQAPPARGQDGRYVEEDAPEGDAPYDVQDQNQNPDSYSDQYQGQDSYPPQDANLAPYDAPPDQQAYADDFGPVPAPAPGQSWVVTDACPDGCWAPYSYGGATIVFGAPVFRGGRWVRPYARSYARPYVHRGWSAPAWHGRSSPSYRAAPRSYVSPRSYSGSRGRTWSGSSGSRGTWGGGRRRGR